MKLMRAALMALALGTSTAALAAPAEGPDPRFTGSDLFSLTAASDPQISPDGRWIAYARRANDIMTDRARSSIWLIDTASGEQRPLVAGAGSHSSPRWSPDGTHIAFISTRGDKPQIYLIPVDGGEARAITSLKQGVGSGLAWSPDGTKLAFTAVPVEEPRDPSKPYRLTRFIYRFDELEYLDDTVQALYVMDSIGSEPRCLTSDRQHYRMT